MRIHELKIQRKHFVDVVTGRKKAEIRKHDRDFKVGDFLQLNEIDEHGTATCEGVRVRVTHILPGGEYGLDADYSILSIERIARTRVMNIDLGPVPDRVDVSSLLPTSQEELEGINKSLNMARRHLFNAESNIHSVPGICYRGFTVNQMLEYIRSRGPTVEVTTELDPDGDDMWRVALSGRGFEVFDGATLFQAAKGAFERFADDAVRDRIEARDALNKAMRWAQ